MQKKSFFTVALCCVLSFPVLFGQNNNAPFEKIEEAQIEQKSLERRIIPQRYEIYQLNFNQLQTILKAAPKRQFPQPTPSEVILTLPTPDGGRQDFVIYDDPIMEKGLADKFPEIKTYCGMSLKEKGTYVRFDLTPTGFHAMVLANDKETIFIDPYYHLDNQYYTVYWKKDYAKPKGKDYVCKFDDLEENIEILSQKAPIAEAARAGDCGVLRTYRLALACSVEYSTFCGGTVALTQAAMVTTMNRVNTVYERDFALHMNIIADNWKVIYATGPSGPTGATNYTTSTDPYTNTSGSTMLTENQTTCDANIGTANYDIGHVFSTGGGGVATLNSPCGTGKARGVTGSSSPVGDPFDIDYVAHEMGHQWGGPHTFAAGSASTGSCSTGNVSAANAYEPGSGTTIQAYAGICSPVNVQSNSDAYFHAGSLASMMSFITGTGNTCAVVTNTGNLSPTANAGLDYSIPISTPFTLVGIATDADGDALTGCWEQMDAAVISTAPTGTATSGSLFRSLTPTTSLSRTIPKIADIVSNATTTWEKLPSVARTINMRFTVRDNKAGFGCTKEDNMVINTIATGAPFVVTYPTLTGVTWTGLNAYNVTWNVVGTDAAPINAATVKILLSTDGGFTYPTTLATGIPNTGTASVVCPNTPTTTARIRVQAENNIFFDISNNNFTIVLGGANYTIASSNASQTGCSGLDYTYNITSTSLLSYTDPISFAVSGLPSGTSGVFTNNNITPGTNTDFILSGTSALAAGTYNFNINATSTAGAKSLTLTLKVYTSGAASPTLLTPTNAATLVSRTPSFTWSSNINALNYSLQVATDAGFSNVVVAANNITNTTYTTTSILATNTLHYWRIQSNNTCGGSVYGAANTFTTNPSACILAPATNPVLTISATGTPIVYSTINLNASGTINDVNIKGIIGTHSYISDLRVSVKSPISTTYVRLWTGLCGANQDFNISFDDESANAYAAIACPMTGGLTYKPNVALTAFDGQAMTGIWTLKIEDLANQDGGTLVGWQTEACALNLVLPVTLVDFKVAAKKDNIALSWETTTETNNKGFEIQRSDDFNTGFRKIDFVGAQASKNTTKFYQYTDNEVVAGKTYYYRLRQLDNDERETFSDIKAANLKKDGIWDISLSPNPATDFFRLSIFAKNKEAKQIEISSIDGKLIKRFETIENEMNIAIESLEQGLYVVKVASEGELFVKKFLKK
jgi:subtilisin-like proprotein convertase family protein